MAPGVLFPAINYTPNPLPTATAGVYNCIPITTTGTGVGAVLLVTINAASVIGGVQIVSSGGGYGVGDTITIPVGQITGATVDLVITIGASEISSPPPTPTQHQFLGFEAPHHLPLLVHQPRKLILDNIS